MPCSSQKARCTGCSIPTGARPSIVVTEAPSACTASTVQLLTAWLSSRIVQVPHWLVSQPMWVPVRPRLSRKNCTRSVRGSTSACRSTLLTVSVIGIRTPALSLLTVARAPLLAGLVFEASEKLAHNHLRRRLHDPAADARQRATHSGVTRVVDQGAVTIVAQRDAGGARDLTRRA